MSFTDLLTQKGDVSRYTEGLPDAYGNKVKTWATTITDAPCRLNAIGGKEISLGAEVVIANYQLFIGDVDLTEKDRVIIDSVTYEVLLVRNLQDATGNHHLECYLQAVR